MTVSRPIQAVILAGGLGVRLRPLTQEVPKPMVPVAGKPYLEHQFRLLAEQEIRDVVLLTGHLGEQIEEHFGDGSRFGLAIRYSREREPLGTGGALLEAIELLNDDFLVIYGDSLLPIEYREVMSQLHDSNAEGVLVVYDNRRGDTSVRNNIALASGARIVRYAKDERGAADLTHVDAGVAALKNFGDWPRKFPAPISLENHIYTELIRRRTLLAHETRQRFYDIGTPDRLAAIEEYLRS